MKVNKKIIIAVVVVLILAAVALLLVFTLAGKGKEEKVKVQAQAQGPVRVACVGDSITYGYGIEPREGNDYPAQLQALLGDGYEVKNYGLVGRTLSLSGDKPYIREPAFLASKSEKPEIVILMLGTNDTKKRNWDKECFEQDCRYFLENYYALPFVKEVYVLLPPALFTDESDASAPRNSILENEVIPIWREVAAGREVPVIDLYTLFKAKPELLSDGCHPTKEGAALIAQTVAYEILKK